MKALLIHFRSPPSRWKRHDRLAGLNSTDSAGTDGVSLQLMERRNLMEVMGHQVAICSAYAWADYPVPALEFDSEAVTKMMRNLFGQEIVDFSGEDELRKAFDSSCREMKQELMEIIESFGPDVIFAHNMMSLPVHPVATVALAELLRETGIPCAAVHHDILSEGAYKFTPTCDFARKILEDYYPPAMSNLNHWTINSRNHRELKKRGIDAVVMHDVVDFDAVLEPAERAAVRSSLREKYGIRPDDIVLFVGARIVPNKQTELTGHLNAAVKELCRDRLGSKLYNGEVLSRDSRVLLVLGGRPERAFSEYRDKLLSLFDTLKIDWMYLGDEVSPRWGDDGTFYPLYPDMYNLADFSLYPSVWEGFGSLVLKTFASRLPLVVFEYPVYKEDIAPKGVRVVSLGDTVLDKKDTAGLVRLPPGVIEKAAGEVVALLTDSELYRSTTEHNYALGKKYFSLDTLRDHLNSVLRWAGTEWVQDRKL